MPDIYEIYFGFDGRIGRRTWWLGTLGLIAASIAGTAVIDPRMFTHMGPLPHLASWSDTIWQLALLIPGTALMVKRFNDRDRPYWLGYAYGSAGAVLTVTPHLNAAMLESMGFGGTFLLSVFALAYLFALIDNGLMRGTAGANRYGADPLAVSAYAT